MMKNMKMQRKKKRSELDIWWMDLVSREEE